MKILKFHDATEFVESAKDFALIFSINSGFESDIFNENFTLLKIEGFPLFIATQNITIQELHAMRVISSTFLINKTPEHTAVPVIFEAEKIGFRIFQSNESSIKNLSHFQTIEFIEYIVSSDKRLVRFPKQSIKNISNLSKANVVFVLDLIQDFEILSPFIFQFSIHFAPKSCSVLISQRVRKSHLWSLIFQQLTFLKVVIHLVDDVIQAAELLPRKAGILFSASESSASGHSFCYRLCKLSPPSLLRVTFQHGYENIGLRHHLSHNANYPNGIRFSSDIIFTWMNKEQLVDAFPSELDRCIPVGVTKKLASDASLARIKYSDLHQKDFSLDSKPLSLLLCENLHSVRFNANLRDSFFSFLKNLQKLPMIELHIRSHPGKRLLENNAQFQHLDFVKNELTQETLSSFDFAVSPASTIILDAVLCGVCTATWSANKISGDLRYHDSLWCVDGVENLFYFVNLQPRERTNMVLENFTWAARNLTSFDGTKFVMSHLSELF